MRPNLLTRVGPVAKLLPNEAEPTLLSTVGDPFTEFSKWAEDLFRSTRLKQGNEALTKIGSYPRLDIYEDSENSRIRIQATVPGLISSDVSLEYLGDYLYICGNSQMSSEHDDRKWHLKEIHKSSFRRAVYLPSASFNIDELKAVVENGLLTITVPYTYDVMKGRKLKVEGPAERGNGSTKQGS